MQCSISEDVQRKKQRFKQDVDISKQTMLFRYKLYIIFFLHYLIDTTESAGGYASYSSTYVSFQIHQNSSTVIEIISSLLTTLI